MTRTEVLVLSVPVIFRIFKIIRVVGRRFIAASRPNCSGRKEKTPGKG